MKKTLFVFLLPWLWAIGPAGAQPIAGSFNSGLRISEAGTGSGDFIVEWFGADGFYYLPERSSDLVNWSWMGNFGVGNGRVLSFNFSTSDGRDFVRLQYSDDPSSGLLSADYNGARISTWEQIQLGYNPFDWVDDGTTNGIHDAWEMFWFQTTGINALDDPNQDGLSNIDKFRYGIDPLLDEAEQVESRENYGYDVVGRLTSFSVTMVPDVYDNEGNIVTSIH